MTPIIGAADLEVRLIGNEGMLGISLMLGVDGAPFHARVIGGVMKITYYLLIYHQ
jgi:hypothetical protein